MQSRFYTALLILSSLALLAFVGLAGIKEMSPEWRKYQTDYKRLYINNANTDDLRKKAQSYTIGVKQIYLKDLNRVERCTICHDGVENPVMAKEKIPYKKHSGTYLQDHPVNKFGCTVCHLGQGRATNKREAHGEGEETHWDYSVLSLKYTQSSCAQCHDYEFLTKHGANTIVAGANLFNEKGCRGCHKLQGKGGSLGKPLDNVGSQPIHYFSMKNVEGERIQPVWIKEHFEDPRRIVPESAMRVNLTPDEITKLTTYILSIRSEEMPKVVRRINGMNNEPPADANGEMLYKIYCVACHNTGKLSAFDEVLKHTVPAIMNEGFLVNADDQFIKTVITEGRKGTPMTSWQSTAAGLTPQNIDAIEAYIATQRTALTSPAFAGDIGNANKDAGKALYDVRCALCHGDKGQGGLGLSLANSIVARADAGYLGRTIRDGRPETPMPSFGAKGMGLTDQNIIDIIAYVKTFSK